MPRKYTRRFTPEQRFWAKVNKDGPAPFHAPELGSCWLWTKARYRDGYGKFDTSAAHFFSAGRPPAGLEWDHLCRVRHCVRPSHLEAVTHQVNVLRGESPSAAHARATHCPAGHPYDETNTYRRSNRVGRECLICVRILNRAAAIRYRARLKAAKATA